MKRFALFIALMVFMGGVAFAQVRGGGLDQNSKEALKELYKEVRDYAQANIVPKMREWKGKLDQSMSSSDLQALNDLRDRAAQLKKRGQRLGLALKKALQEGNFGEARQLRAKIKELGNQREELLKDLKPLGVEYKSTLLEIGKESKPYGKEWLAGIKKVGREWYEDHKDDLSVGFKAALGKAIERLRMLGALMDGATIAKLAAAKFMLWDGQDLPEMAQMLMDEDPGAEGSMDSTPEGFVLEANYPNPFNPSTTIAFTIPKAERVSLVVYDVLGKEVTTLIDSELSAGSHSVVFDGKNLASGTYIYRIRAGAFVQEKSMQLLK